jgi:hypothetical protein
VQRANENVQRCQIQRAGRGRACLRAEHVAANAKLVIARDVGRAGVDAEVSAALREATKHAIYFGLPCTRDRASLAKIQNGVNVHIPDSTRREGLDVEGTDHRSHAREAFTPPDLRQPGAQHVERRGQVGLASRRHAEQNERRSHHPPDRLDVALRIPFSKPGRAGWAPSDLATHDGAVDAPSAHAHRRRHPAQPQRIEVRGACFNGICNVERRRCMKVSRSTAFCSRWRDDARHRRPLFAARGRFWLAGSSKTAPARRSSSKPASSSVMGATGFSSLLVILRRRAGLDSIQVCTSVHRAATARPRLNVGKAPLAHAALKPRSEPMGLWVAVA